MIQYNDIGLRYGEKQIFHNFNLHIKKEDKVLLKMPSGSGKSTLLKMLLGLIQPDSGEILFNEKPLDKSTCHLVRQACAYVSQDVDLPFVPVKELVQRVNHFKSNLHLSLDQNKVLSTFDLFDLDREIFNKNVKTLSGGERQRLGLVLCVLLDRPVWLLDEVTSGLDNKLKETVFELVTNSMKTVMIVSHDDIWTSKYIRKVEW